MATQEEKEAELARLEKENELAELDAENHQLSGANGDVGPLDYLERSAKGIPQIMQDQFPLANTIRKAGYATAAGLKSGFDEDEYNKNFTEMADRDNAEMEKTRRETPEPARWLAQNLGMMATLGLGGAPAATAAAPGMLAKVGRVGGMAALGTAERGLSNPNPNQFWDSEEATQGGLISGGLQAGVEAFAPALSKGLDKEWLLENARERAVKAGWGQNKAAQVKAMNTGSATGNMTAHAYAGDYLLGRHKPGAEPILGWKDRSESLLPKLERAAEEQAPRLGQLTEDIDQAYPQGLVDPRNISGKMRGYADSLPHTQQTAPVIGKVQREAQIYDEASKLGRIPRPGEITSRAPQNLSVNEGGPRLTDPDLFLGQSPHDLGQSRFIEPPATAGVDIDSRMTGNAGVAPVEPIGNTAAGPVQTGGPRMNDEDLWLGRQPREDPAGLMNQAGDDLGRAQYLQPPTGAPGDIDSRIAGNAGMAPVPPSQGGSPSVRTGGPRLSEEQLWGGQSPTDLGNARYLTPPRGPSANIDVLLGAESPRKNISFGDVRHQKQGYPFDGRDPSKQTFGQEGSNELYRIVMREENDAAARAASDPNLSQELRDRAAQFRQMKAEEQANIILQQGTRDRVAANKANRAQSLTDYMSSGVGGMLAGAPGLALGLVNRAARTRGSAFAARGLNATLNVANKVPQSLTQYGKAVGGGLNAGNTALGLSRLDVFKGSGSSSYDDAETDYYRRQILSPTRP
jgi:hypothetical protein